MHLNNLCVDCRAACSELPHHLPKTPCLVGLALVLVSAVLVRPVSVNAQEVVTCQTINGPKTTAQITAELQRAGYAGPWDSASQAAAYARASGGPVTCGGITAASGPAMLVVLIAGYGSDLETAGDAFTAVQQELLERDANVLFVQYSYTGSTVQGCSSIPNPYQAADTAQDINTSKQVLIATIQALQTACPNEPIAVLGHSLGGLIGFQALAEHPLASVRKMIAVDSPLGGAPLTETQVCVSSGICADGPLSPYLAQLYASWNQTAAANAKRDAALKSAHTGMSAWGNQSDCLYYAVLCATAAVSAIELLGGTDARETQWLGVADAVRKDYVFAPRIWNILPSHEAVMINAAPEMAAALLS